MESRHWTIRDHEEDVVHEEQIGSGGFGEVHKVRFQTFIQYAILT
jgi:hypothetical protein